MENKLNDKAIVASHSFGINDTNFTILRYDKNIIPCVFFKNPDQSKIDEFLNGTSYLFYSIDFIQQNLQDIKNFKKVKISM